MPKSIAEEWTAFVTVLAIRNPPLGQIREMRRAFYAGIWSALCRLKEVGGPNVSEDEGVAMLADWVEECERFKNHVLNGTA